MRLKMDEFKFKSLEELYKKLIPAFNVRVNDLKRSKINGITREDIWNYLKNNNWIRREHLTLGEMVDDIINVSDKDLMDYKIKNNNNKCLIFYQSSIWHSKSKFVSLSSVYSSTFSFFFSYFFF